MALPEHFTGGGCDQRKGKSEGKITQKHVYFLAFLKVTVQLQILEVLLEWLSDPLNTGGAWAVLLLFDAKKDFFFLLS